MYVEREFCEVTKTIFSPKKFISSLHGVSSLLDSRHHAYRYQSFCPFKSVVKKCAVRSETFCTVCPNPIKCYVFHYVNFLVHKIG